MSAAKGALMTLSGGALGLSAVLLAGEHGDRVLRSLRRRGGAARDVADAAGRLAADDVVRMRTKDGRVAEVPTEVYREHSECLDRESACLSSECPVVRWRYAR